MPIDRLSPFIREHYEIHEWRHASAILASDFPAEFADIQAVLDEFRLYRSRIQAPGGSKSDIAGWIWPGSAMTVLKRSRFASALSSLAASSAGVVDIEYFGSISEHGSMLVQPT